MVGTARRSCAHRTREGEEIDVNVTAPAAQCQPDDGPSGLGNGPSPFEYPAGFPRAL
jgi:hypothetical protein